MIVRISTEFYECEFIEFTVDVVVIHSFIALLCLIVAA